MKPHTIRAICWAAAGIILTLFSAYSAGCWSDLPLEMPTGLPTLVGVTVLSLGFAGYIPVYWVTLDAKLDTASRRGYARGYSDALDNMKDQLPQGLRSVPTQN